MVRMLYAMSGEERALELSARLLALAHDLQHRRGGIAHTHAGVGKPGDGADDGDHRVS